MASKYAAQYIERAKRDVKNFEQACRVLRFDPEKAVSYTHLTLPTILLV